MHVEQVASSNPSASICAAGAILCVLIVGCRTAPQAERAGEIVDLPDHYAHQPVDRELVQDWSAGFGIPELEGLIRLAFTNNLDLAAARARLLQAEAIARQAGSSLWPSTDAEGQASRSRVSSQGFQFGGPSGPGGPGGFPLSGGDNIIDQYQVSIGAAYEVDLWGRLRNLRDAAELDARAARFDAASLANTLAARVAENYFLIRAQNERIQLLDDQVGVSEQFLELTLLRLGQGQATALDVTQQEQQVESLRTLLARERTALALARNQLKVLAGATPEREAMVRSQSLPSLPRLPDPGLPMDLLDRRPDVRAAHARIRAGDRRTAAAIADLFPRIRLSASLFFQEQEASRLFNEVLWTLAGAASQPVFDGGRRSAEIDRAEAAAVEQLNRYGQTILTALREVEDALVSEARQEEVVQGLEVQRASAEESLRLATARYQEGAIDYLRVLTAILSLQQIERDLIEARRQRFSNRIQLCRALGGGWDRHDPVQSAEAAGR